MRGRFSAQTSETYGVTISDTDWFDLSLKKYRIHKFKLIKDSAITHSGLSLDLYVSCKFEFESHHK